MTAYEMRISDWSSDVCSSDLFRTPLNAILGFSETMAKEIFGPVGSPRYLDYAETIHRSGRKLLQMVSQILDFTESEAGTLQLTESSTNLAMTEIGRATCRDRVCQ